MGRGSVYDETETSGDYDVPRFIKVKTCQVSKTWQVCQ